MQVIVHKNIEILDEIIPNWGELKGSFHEVTIFQELNWLKSWWENHENKMEDTPFVIEVKKENTTIGILPFYLTYKEFSGYWFRILKPIGSYLSDYLLPICSNDYSIEETLCIIFDHINADKLQWDCIEWNDIPENSSLDKFFGGKYISLNNSINRRRINVCPYLILDKNVENVKNKFSKKFLKGILYYERKLKREGNLRYCRVKYKEEIGPIMNTLFELHCRRWNITNTPSQFRFRAERNRIISIAYHLFNLGLLHLSYLSHNDEIVAVEFGMIDGKKRYLYIGAINTNYKKYPVGHILLYNLITEACEQGYEIMDFLRGDEAYKSRVGTINNYNVQYLIFNKSIRSELFSKINKTYYSDKFQKTPIYMQIISKSFIRGMIYILKLPIFRIKYENEQKLNP